MQNILINGPFYFKKDGELNEQSIALENDAATTFELVDRVIRVKNVNSYVKDEFTARVSIEMDNGDIAKYSTQETRWKPDLWPWGNGGPYYSMHIEFTINGKRIVIDNPYLYIESIFGNTSSLIGDILAAYRREKEMQAN